MLPSPDGPDQRSCFRKPSSMTAFRPGGRGSKQLAKALQENGEVSAEPEWVLCTGKEHTYFARIVNNNTGNNGDVYVQPLHQSPHDPSLLKLWDGHLFLAKRQILHPVLMKQEPGGWRVVVTPQLEKRMEVMKSGKGKGNSWPNTCWTPRPRTLF